jgi:hypothetical protein
METIINNSILRATGKVPEGLDRELIRLIVKNTNSYVEALVNLIICAAVRDETISRSAVRDVAVSIIDEFKKDLNGVIDTKSQELIALAVITAYFTNPKLITIAMLKIMTKKETAA